MAYSFSQIKMLHECPYKYYQSYVNHIKIRGSIYALFGQAMHALLKDIVENNYDRQEAIREWAYYFEAEATKDGIRFYKNYEFLLKKGYVLISIYFKNRDKLDIQKVISVEVKDKMSFDGDEFVYVCDIIYENSKGEIVLLDYKTGKVKTIDLYQIEFYSWQDKYGIDKICLYYFDEPHFYDVGQYKDETEKYVRSAIKTAKGGDFYKIITKYCNKCDLFVIGKCDAKYDEPNKD